MKKLLYTLGLLLLFSLVSFLCVYSFSISKENDEVKRALEMNREKNDVLVENFAIQLNIQGIELSDSIECINLRKQKRELKEIIGQRKLVLYMGYEYCSSCVDEIVMYFAKNNQTIHKDKFVVLFDCIPDRDFSHFASKYGNFFEIYSFINEVNNEKLNGNAPLLFISDAKLEVKDVYKPIRNSENDFLDYMKTINNKYFTP